MKSRNLYLCLALVSSSLFCAQRDYEFEEMKQDVEDIKHILHTFRVDMRLLEEKLDKQKQYDMQIEQLEKKIAFLEKNQDLKAAEYSVKNRELSQQLEEISKVKNTLNSISAAMVQKQKLPSSSSETYKIQSGDSLEKIARKFHTTVDAIKKLNSMNGDRIIVGKELQIPHEPTNIK